MPAELTEQEYTKAWNAKGDVNQSTIDNNATTTEIQYLARLYQATQKEKYKEGVLKGIQYLLKAQYDNDGWNQFYPRPTGYYIPVSYTHLDVIENQITEPLEQNINGIPGIRSLSSVSQQGQSRITVEFELSVDLETAANDVRDKVSRAQRYLPRDCDPPTVSKADADAMPILMVALQSDKRSLLELSEIADLTVKEQLQTISDVSSVSVSYTHLDVYKRQLESLMA